MASAEDLKSVLEFLNITSINVLSHDIGAGIATALAAKYPDLVRRLVVTEYLLPGFGFELARNPGVYWDLHANWQLAFFSVTDAAEFFISGKEKQMLEWYFYHGSYSGATSFSEDIVNRYTSSISKPGFLRAILAPFETRTIASAASFFKDTLGKRPLQMPTLAMGGEASLGPFASQARGNVTSYLETDIVPKAGHWIADENPASRVDILFSEESSHPPPPVDLSVLNNKATLTVGYFGTLQNVASSSNL